MRDEVLVERVIKAPREHVWKAWTSPELIKQWWGPEDFTAPYVQIDFREGGKYVYAMHWPAGSEWDKDMYSAGEFKEIVPNEKIRYSDWFSDEQGHKRPPSEFGMPEGFPDESEATVKFEDAGEGQTKLTIVSHYPDDPKVAQAIKDSGGAEGWASSLNKLAKVVE